MRGLCGLCNTSRWRSSRWACRRKATPPRWIVALDMRRHQTWLSLALTQARRNSSSLYSLKLEKTSLMLVVNEIAFVLYCLYVVLVLLIFALSAILFSRSVRLDDLQLVVSKPNIAVSIAKNLGHATLLGLHCF